MFRDLRPYVCTYEHCTEADQQYDSITEWITHEYYNHNNAMHYPGRIHSGDFLASQQDEISRPPGLYDVCREQCPLCDEERPSVSHVGRHLRKIAAFTLPRLMIMEDDIAPVSQDFNEANLESDEDPAERLLDFELDLYEITPEKQPPTPGINLEAKPGEVRRTASGEGKMPVAQSINAAKQTILAHLSFYVRIEPISPDYGGEARRQLVGAYWVPPSTPKGFRHCQDPVPLLRWEGGRNSIVPANHPIQGVDLDRSVYRAATIFTQYPDTPHLLSVPFDARTTSVQQSRRGWQSITFNHIRVGDSNSNAYYSYISSRGAERKIAAPGSPHWIPQLLSDWYDSDPRHVTRIQAGLIGDLPLLFALAAFSAPPESSFVLLSSMLPGRWVPHGLLTGRK